MVISIARSFKYQFHLRSRKVNRKEEKKIMAKLKKYTQKTEQTSQGNDNKIKIRDISFIKIINKMGPRIESCVTT